MQHETTERLNVLADALRAIIGPIEFDYIEAVMPPRYIANVSRASRYDKGWDGAGETIEAAMLQAMTNALLEVGSAEANT